MMQKKEDFLADMKNMSLAVLEIDSSTIMSLLSLIYSGEFDDEGKDLSSVLNLYFKADKYKLNKLKKECCKQLNQMISEENVGYLLSISETYNDVMLKENVEDFVSLNADKILESSEWKKIVRTKWELPEESEIHQNIAKAAKEFGSSIVMTILHLLYCRKTNVEQENMDFITTLYENANKYCIIQLKEVCISLIRLKINEINVGKVLMLSNT